MKFGVTGRDNVDKSKFITNQPRGSFLDRFKGRTMHISKEGHLGVVQNTKIPIKPIYDQPYSNTEVFENQSKIIARKYIGETNRNSKPMSNFEALTPIKRSNSIAEDNFQTRNNRFNTFEKDIKMPQNTLSNTNPPGLRVGLSKAGDNIMRNSLNSFNSDYPKINSSHSMKAGDKLFKPDFRINNDDFKTPNTTSNDPYSSMKIPLSMAASLKGSSTPNESNMQKSSFYSPQSTIEKPTPIKMRSSFNANDFKKVKSHPSPYAENKADRYNQESTDDENTSANIISGINNRMKHRRSVEVDGNNDMKSALSLLHKSLSKKNNITILRNSNDNITDNRKSAFRVQD